MVASRVCSVTTGKNFTNFSMRLTKNLLLERGLFLYCSNLIFPDAFKPERERMRNKSEHVAWWCVVRHFALLRQKKPLRVISCEQESVPCGKRWFHLEKNCFALCKRPSFRQEVSETCCYVNMYWRFGENIHPPGHPAYQCLPSKLSSVFYASVLLLIMNFIFTLSK